MSVSSVKTGLIRDELLVGNSPYIPIVSSVEYLVIAGGGGGGSNASGGSGGSGVVILRYPDTRTISVGAGLTTSHVNQAVGTNERYTRFTAGTGTVSWS